MTFSEITLYISKAIDIIGIAIIVIGLFVSSFIYILNLLEKNKSSYKLFRQNFGKVILLGLEFLIAGDIIITVATTPTLNDAIVLAVIVAVRMVISFQLQVEIHGRWPWKKI
ncbi:MAG: DUF1622 domain-containing protein [bacterium]